MSRNNFGMNADYKDFEGSHNPFDDDYTNSPRVMTKAYTPQDRALASQQRSLASMCQSEQVGIDALGELAEQGETLNRAENNVKQIGELQKDGQRSIKSLNSWFSGFKDMFSKKTPVPTANVSKPNTSPQTASYKSPATSFMRENAQINHQISSSTTYQQPKSHFDSNLDQMSSGMARLKGLASTMNAELRTQNEQLDRLDPAIDRVSGTMTQQNQQMNKLLGVKNK